jgi:dimethylaniline monooxygenase (N-oxide forming)
VTVFEARDNIGGQWYYEEPDPATSEVQSSMYEGTISNTCRDTSSFSDFPMDPADTRISTAIGLPCSIP